MSPSHISSPEITVQMNESDKKNYMSCEKGTQVLKTSSSYGPVYIRFLQKRDFDETYEN